MVLLLLGLPDAMTEEMYTCSEGYKAEGRSSPINPAQLTSPPFPRLGKINQTRLYTQPTGPALKPIVL